MKGLTIFDLTGKVALVTGGTHGLGLAIATALAEAGATLVINARKQENINGAIDELARKGIKAYGSLFDVTKEEDVKYGVAKIAKDIGPIDILVNNV